ncbi:FecR family protein [uncultured Draconibacterium sp.]|uniref:FecR family protein n=1 Tax=uncultured Draconibacterium sp. TaxID=1573823 RepID=UPI0025FF666D|nr:FecR domain-containing protein [uncultured Draconibacterium sp.]
MDKSDKIRKWLNGEVSDSEQKEFQASEEFAELSRLMNAVDNFAAPPYDAEKEFEKLAKTTIENKPVISLYQKLSSVIRIAAVLVFVVLAGYFVYDLTSQSANNKAWIAEQTEVYLPDSSFVLLNADSKIRFAESGWENKRNVELQGDAFFRVKKGSQFNVKTKQGKVTVLGTEFEVKDRTDFYEVTCYSGSVKVLANEHSVVLKPNDVFRIIDNKNENYTIANKTEPDWLNGESSFKSVPLKFVVDELERQYQVSVSAKDIDLDQLFTGSFSHKNLEIALESITFPVNLDYEINGNKIDLTIESN